MVVYVFVLFLVVQVYKVSFVSISQLVCQGGWVLIIIVIVIVMWLLLVR